MEKQRCFKSYLFITFFRNAKSFIFLLSNSTSPSPFFWPWNKARTPWAPSKIGSKWCLLCLRAAQQCRLLSIYLSVSQSIDASSHEQWRRIKTPTGRLDRLKYVLVLRLPFPVTCYSRLFPPNISSHFLGLASPAKQGSRQDRSSSCCLVSLDKFITNNICMICLPSFNRQPLFLITNSKKHSKKNKQRCL